MKKCFLLDVKGDKLSHSWVWMATLVNFVATQYVSSTLKAPNISIITYIMMIQEVDTAKLFNIQ